MRTCAVERGHRAAQYDDGAGCFHGFLIETAARLIHSADERVPVEDLELGVSFLRHAAQTIG